MPAMLALPISGRRSCAYLSGLPSTPSTSYEDDTFRLTVKNTFVEVFEDSDQECEAAERRGSKSCMARLTGPVAWPPSQLEQARWCAERDEADQESCDGDDAARQLIYSESTPWGEAPSALAARLFPPALEQVPTPATATVTPVLQQRTASVTLQIPLQVCSGHPLAAGVEGGMSVDVSEQDGQTVIRLCVKSDCAGTIKLASAPPACTVVAPGAPSAAACGGADSDRVPAQAATLRRAGAAGRKAAEAPDKTQKSRMVCCHWKNKGWCKFQDTCRFQHPEHKRGAGIMEKASAALAAVAAQQQVAPSVAAAQLGAGPRGQSSANPVLAAWHFGPVELMTPPSCTPFA